MAVGGIITREKAHFTVDQHVKENIITCGTDKKSILPLLCFQLMLTHQHAEKTLEHVAQTSGQSFYLLSFNSCSSTCM